MPHQIKVELLAFGKKDEIRIVNIPKLSEDIDETLESVFHFGQNDFQPKNHPSVSCGDVINYQNKKFIVGSFGFQELSTKEYNTYLKVEQRMRCIHKFTTGS